MLTAGKGVRAIWSESWQVPGPAERKIAKKLNSEDRPERRGPSTCRLLLVHPTASPQAPLPFQAPAGARLAGVGGKTGSEKKQERRSNTARRQAEVLPVQRSD